MAGCMSVVWSEQEFKKERLFLARVEQVEVTLALLMVVELGLRSLLQEVGDDHEQQYATDHEGDDTGLCTKEPVEEVVDRIHWYAFLHGSVLSRHKYIL